MIHLEQKMENGYPSKIVISYWDSDGMRQGTKFSVPKSELFEWAEITGESTEELKSAFGNSIIKQPLKKYKRLSKYRVYELIGGLSKETQDKLHTQNIPIKTFFDIETMSVDGGDFPDANNPQYPVISNSFVTGNKVVMYGMVKLDVECVRNMESRINNHFVSLKEKNLLPKEKYVLEYRYFDTEENLLKAIFNYMRDNTQMLFGWNSLKFDQRYLANRTLTMNGYDLSDTKQWDRKYSFMNKNLSPTNSSFVLRLVDKFAKNQEKVQVPVPTHVPMLDYMELYGKFDFSLKSSMRLDVVASNVLKGIKKLEYDGSLQEFYERDPESFYLYNIIDSILVQLIDQKVNVFSTPLALSQLVKVPIHDTLFAGIMCEKLFCDKYYESGEVFIDKYGQHEKTPYQGGYVHEPKKGMLHDIMIYDFASMFPTGMMAFNYGIDTKIGNTGNNKTYYDDNGGEHNIDKAKHIISPNGIVYTKEKGDSSLREMVFYLFNGRMLRKKWSKETMAEAVALEAGESIKDPKHYNPDNDNDTEIKRLKQLSQVYANESNAMKIIMNSIYGVLGYVGFALYNVDVASSVTSQSRDLIQYTMERFNTYFKEHWKTDTDAHKLMGVKIVGDYDYKQDVIVYADTDSVFSEMTKIIDDTDLENKDNWEVRRDFLLDLSNKVIEPYIVKFLNEYCDKYGAYTSRPDGSDSFGLGLEQINKSVLFIKKKKYIKNTIWSEGSYYDPLMKLNPKGVEMNQSSKPPFIREKLKQITLKIMSQDKNFNMKSIISEMKIVKEEFLRADIPQLAEVLRVNDISKYVISDNPLMFASGAPANAKASATYNNFVKTNPEMSKYKLILNGDKVGIFYTLSGDSKKPTVFAYPVNEGIPHIHPKIDHKSQFEKMILNPINNMLKVIDEADKLDYKLVSFSGGLEW